MFKKFAGVLIAVAPVAAFAEVPAAATTMLTGIATDFGTLLTAGYVLMAVVLGGLILMKLVKKVSNRAT